MTTFLNGHINQFREFGPGMETYFELYYDENAKKREKKGEQAKQGQGARKFVFFEEKIFIEFVALIIRNRMYNHLRDAVKEMAKKPNYMTVPAAIRELDKIEMARQLDGVYRLDHAVTATQKTILKAFGLTDANVKYRAEEISKRLESGI